MIIEYVVMWADMPVYDRAVESFKNLNDAMECAKLHMKTAVPYQNYYVKEFRDGIEINVYYRDGSTSRI